MNRERFYIFLLAVGCVLSAILIGRLIMEIEFLRKGVVFAIQESEPEHFKAGAPIPSLDKDAKKFIFKGEENNYGNTEDRSNEREPESESEPEE